MPNFRAFVLFLLSLTLLLPHFALSVAAEPTDLPSVSAHAAILVEAESGNTVWARNATERLPMASTTKLMSALTALSLAPRDRVIVVDPQAVGVEGSSVYLSEGEELTLEALLLSLMLESANDAAVAIAIGLCGSVDAFAAQMNELAAAWGLQDTHFTNPHGLDDREHYTTARDLAQIARRVLENEALLKIVSTKKATIPHEGVNDARLLVNHNKLLRTYDGCIGMKTGFTKKSGRCLVSAAERDGVRMIAVTLNAPDDWRDHTSLLDYGFSRYRSLLLCEAEALCINSPVVGGTCDTLRLTNADGVRVTLPSSEQITVREVVELPRFFYAPITAGEPLGRVVWLADTDGDGESEVLGESPLIATSSVEQKDGGHGFLLWLRRLFDRWFSN